MSQGNQLHNAASPYLLQHKDNPVHWREWSTAALEEARQAGKPVLLSIGYAACHWCHVMAHESFEDQATADVMNELFVNIKVDREERPDIDQIYMAALHALGQQGGWPLTMFVTPAGEPFWGGTYFPNTSAYGRPSFVDVMRQVHQAYHETPEKIAGNTKALRERITGMHQHSPGPAISEQRLDEFARKLYPHMDLVNGGMQGAPKFPNCQILELFLRAASRSKDKTFNQPFLKTLKQICLGGIHDQIGGGFSRYSVDERWHVPHFEKMLYDNAQLLELFAQAWLDTGDTEFSLASESIVSWLERDMFTADGLFAASLDADSENVEGKYYCWTSTEIENVLGSEQADLFCKVFGVTPEGNWTEIHSGTKTNVLNRLEPLSLSISQRDQIESAIKKLRIARSKRIPPALDDKILADWNGMMIGALARAALVFDRPEWLTLSAKAFHNVIESMARRDGEHIRIGHSLRNGRLVWPGISSDYVAIARAALLLNENGATFHPVKNLQELNSYLAIALALTDSLIAFHADEETGLVSLPASDADDVIYRSFMTTDDATPNPNSILIQNLQILAAATGKPKYHTHARKMIEAMTGPAMQNPYGHASFLNAIDSRLQAAEIIITGRDGEQLAAVARNRPFHTRFVLNLDPDSIGISERYADSSASNEAMAFICRHETCSLPISDVSALETALAG